MSKNSPLKNMLLLALREVLHQKAYGKNYRPYGYGQPKRQRGLKAWLTPRACSTAT